MFKGFTYFVKFAWKRKKIFIITTFIREVIAQMFPIFSIILPKFIIDGITENRGWQYIATYIIIYISLNLLANVLDGIFMHLSNTARNKLYYETIEYIAEKVNTSDYNTIESDSFLHKQNMAKNYMFAGGLFGGIYDRSMEVIGNILKFIAIIAIVSTLSFWIVLILIIVVLFNSFVKSRFNHKYYEVGELMRKTGRKADYFTQLLEDREYGKESRINVMTNYLIKKLKKPNQESFNAGNMERNYGFFMRIVRGVTGFFQEGLAYFYLAFQVLGGAITIGSFTMYINAISQFSNSMLEVMNSIIEIKRIDLNYKDFDEYMNLPQKMREGKKLSVENPHSQHSIEFKNVFFKYPGNENYILKNINIKINAGEKLSVVGENGAGKTTFIKLLVRLYDPTEGEIFFDGINIKDLDYDEYMNALSVVFQDFKLFAFSIKENIALEKTEDVSDEKILEILEKSGLGENIKKFDKGIHTTVYKEFDDNGIELSGGESQKLSIARALFKNGGIVVLDEPTAALDPRSEYDIYMRFNELVKGKTAIYISHRLSSARFCDKVAVFENGEIVEYGSHNELVEQNNLYADLYNKQAQFYVDVENKTEK